MTNPSSQVVDLSDSKVTSYSIYPEVQTAFERMSALGVELAAALREEPRGHVAFIAGYSYWISDTYIADEAMCVPAGPGAYAPTEDEFPMFLSDIEGLGAGEMDDISDAIGNWLRDRKLEPVDVQLLDRIALATAIEWRGGLDRSKEVKLS